MDNKVFRLVNGGLLFVGLLVVANQEAVLANVPDEYRALVLILILGIREYLKEAKASGEPAVSEDDGETA